MVTVRNTGPRPTPASPMPTVAPSASTAPGPSTPPPAPTAPPPLPTVSAATTRRVEAMLRRAGFSPGRVDQTYTRSTADALSQFQQSVGLPSTGAPDRRTLSALQDVNRRISRSRGKWVGAGQKSADILTQEKRLRRLGYNPGKVDGVYDRSTASAVRAFRKDQKELKDNVGGMGTGARSVLARESAALGHAPQRTRVKPSAERTAADARVQTAATRTQANGQTGLGVGSRGAAVRTVQQHLRAAGYDPKSTAGTFDERTEGVLRQFQKQSGLEPTGRVDAGTWRALRGATMEARSDTSPSQRVNERSSAVLRTERMLKDLGLNTGKVDGLFTAQTQRAVDAFRRREKLSGKGDGVGPRLLKRLRSEWKDSRGITLGQLVKTMPGLSRSRARQLLNPLNAAMREYGITTEKRREAFLAQLGHESVSLRYFEEIASGAAYEGRADLGNTQRGDGVRFKGRGPIQLTGRANYRRAGAALGLPLERKPWLASRPSVGFRIAGWFWKTHGLNAKADRSDFYGITRSINGGTNGLADRLYRWSIAKRVIH